MLVEQVIYGLFGDNYDTLKTEGVDELVDEEALHYLVHQGDKLQEPRDITNLLGDVIAVSYISFRPDRYRRRTVWNHTFLTRLVDFLDYMKPENVFKDKVLTEPPEKLEPLTL